MMFRWIGKSFRREVITLLITVMFVIGVGIISKNYVEEKQQLNSILKTQLYQLSHIFSMSISSYLFYNQYFELSDAIINLYDYNRKSAEKSGTLFLIDEIAIVDENGNIMGHSNPEKYPIGTRYTMVQKYINKDGNKKNIIFWNEEKTKLSVLAKVVYAKKKVGYIFMSINPIFLEKSKEALFSSLAILLVLFLVVIVLVSVVFAKWIHKPIEEILGKLEHLGEGNLNFDISLTRQDEFYTFATVLRNTDRRIYEQTNKLKEIQQNLEQLVQERTKELEATLKDLQNYQKKIIETEKMSSLGSLVAGVSHEINTPIGVSLTGITFIESETKKVIKAMQEQKLGKNALKEYLQNIDVLSNSMHISLRNAANLVKSFKQIAIDQHTEEKRIFNLRNYFDEIVLSLNSRLKHSPVILINEIEEDLQINSYAGIFSQIFTNFIINSLVHGFEKSSKGDEIRVSSKRDKKNLTLIYEDNGKGIEQKHIDKIFDPFFTTKLGQGGSGLGLNIIYNLVIHKLHATIACQNKEQGIIMTIVIPLEELI